jgi:hypothetical protein
MCRFVHFTARNPYIKKLTAFYLKFEKRLQASSGMEKEALVQQFKQYYCSGGPEAGDIAACLNCSESYIHQARGNL